MHQKILQDLLKFKEYVINLEIDYYINRLLSDRSRVRLSSGTPDKYKYLLLLFQKIFFCKDNVKLCFNIYAIKYLL